MYIKKKTINGQVYRYLTKSIRTPEGKVRTIQKKVSDSIGLKDAEKKYRSYFLEKEKKIFRAYALSRYGVDNVFTEHQISRVEDIRVDYQHTLKKFSREQYRDVFDRFIANFTYESNAIEGNSLTLKDVSIVMFEKTSVAGKELREIYETKNSRKVLDLMLQNKFRVREKDIIRVHKMLMADIDSRLGYKRFPNYIVGSDVELTPPEKVDEGMKDLIGWYEDAVNHIHPLKLSALFHGRFERIHPFADGNGRVGRFLSNIILLRNKYPPLIIRKSQRQSYMKALEDFHRGYTINLERFFLEKYKKTYEKFFKTYLDYIT